MNKILLFIITLITITLADNYGDTYSHSGNIINNTVYNYSKVSTKFDTIVIIDTIHNAIFYGNKSVDTVSSNIHFMEYTHIPMNYIEIVDKNHQYSITYDSEKIRLNHLKSDVSEIFIKTFPSNNLYTHVKSDVSVSMVTQNGVLTLDAERFKVDRLSSTSYSGNRAYKSLDTALKESSYVRVSVRYKDGSYSPIMQFNTIGFNKLYSQLDKIK